MKEVNEALWNLDLLRVSLKRRNVSTENQLQWLGMCEILHDTIHKLDGDCGDPHCTGPDEEVLSHFVDHCT